MRERMGWGAITMRRGRWVASQHNESAGWGEITMRCGGRGEIIIRVEGDHLLE